MRYLLKPDKPVLDWLLNFDGRPSILPTFPADTEHVLVVAQLLSGNVFAEVIPAADDVTTIVGGGVPLGRLYFQIPKTAVYSVCPNADF
jgi:hypothetical protein